MTYQFDTTNLRGRFKTNVNLSNYTWLGVGGNADIFFVPEDKEDLVKNGILERKKRFTFSKEIANTNELEILKNQICILTMKLLAIHD